MYLAACSLAVRYHNTNALYNFYFQDVLLNLAGCCMYLAAGSLAVRYHNSNALYKQYFVIYEQVTFICQIFDC
jgi:hypothetical protein